MSEPITFPAIQLDLHVPPRSKWEREYRAFLQMLPELLKTHRGKYVAVHEGRVVDSGDDKLGLAMKAYGQYGFIPIYVGVVAERPLPPERIPGVREVSEVPAP